MGLREVKKELKKLDKKQLVDLIGDFYKKNKAAREFFNFYVNPDENELLEKYRDKVFEAFYPRSGFNYSLKKGKQAINDFKKLGISSHLLADLILFYVETGVDFTNDFGDIDEPFYTSMAKTYDAALELMDKEGILEEFMERAEKVVTESGEIGWGFSDVTSQIYSDYYAHLIYDEADEESDASENGKITKL